MILEFLYKLNEKGKKGGEVLEILIWIGFLVKKRY